MGVGDIVCVLTDEPWGAALIEEMVESGDEALGRTLDDAQVERGDGVEIGAAFGVGSVEDNEDFKVGAGLRDEALDGWAEPGHALVNGYADGEEAALGGDAVLHSAAPCLVRVAGLHEQKNLQRSQAEGTRRAAKVKVTQVICCELIAVIGLR